MTTTKPFVLCSTCDEFSGIPQNFVDVLNKYFCLIWMEDYKSCSVDTRNEIIAIINFHGMPKVTLLYFQILNEIS